MNRGWVWIPLVFLAGLILGALHPRAELRQTRNELETRKKAEQTPPTQVERLDRLLQLLPMDPPRADSRSQRLPASPASDTASADPESPPALSPTNTDASSAENLTPEERRAQFEARLKQAAEAWRLRAEIARNTFAAQTGLNATELAAFDAAIQTMNSRLETLFSDLANRLRQGETMTPETGLAVLHDASGILLDAYQELDESLPPTWRTDAGPTFDIVQQVDPDVLNPLVEVRDALAVRPSETGMPTPPRRGPIRRLFMPPPPSNP